MYSLSNLDYAMVFLANIFRLILLSLDMLVITLKLNHFTLCKWITYTSVLHPTEPVEILT
ncbi:MAG: hypothetical protein K0S67_894, partial [Nitrososphaeraceae archaeon]|nr:hypothetical protein [Nitrososphaeraceae archaeon]